jgi:anti-sigma28 factor (negative regulator of flagellin synthesis)
MRIEGFQAMNVVKSNSLETPAPEAVSQRTGTVAGATKPGTVDQVASSAQQNLVHLALQTPSPSSSRIDELRNAIQGGTYHADVNETSHAVVNALLNLDS